MRTKINFFLVIIIVGVSNALAQSTVAKWDFENESKRGLVDSSGCISSYEPDEGAGILSLEGGASLGAWVSSGNFASARHWQEGIDSKYWQVTFSSSGFQDILISSKQGSSNTGPRDYRLQYRISPSDSIWKDVTSSCITLGNNWTSGVVEQTPLPEECSNLDSLILRWVLCSDARVSGDDPVSSTGVSRIDDIHIQGTPMTKDESIITWMDNLQGSDFSINPNPARDYISIQSSTIDGISNVYLYNMLGKVVFNGTYHLSPSGSLWIPTHLPAGIYHLSIYNQGKRYSQKLYIE